MDSVALPAPAAPFEGVREARVDVSAGVPRLEAVRQEITPYRERLRTSAALAAEAWVQMDQTFRQTAERLKVAIRDARLEALLPGL